MILRRRFLRTLVLFVSLLPFSTIHITTAFLSTVSFHGAKFDTVARRYRVKPLLPYGSKGSTEDDSEFQLEVLRQKLEALGIAVPPMATRGELEELGVLARKEISTGRSERRTKETPNEDKASDIGCPGRSVAQSQSRRRFESRSRSTQRGVRQGTSTNKEPARRLGSRESRRKRRLQSQGSPETSSTGLRSIPNRLVRIGNRTTKMATRKTKLYWDNLVDLTYDDDVLPQSGRQTRVQRRQSRKFSSKERFSSSDVFEDDLQTKRAYSEPDIRQDFTWSSLDENTVSNVNTMAAETSSSKGTSMEGEELIPIRELLDELDSRQIEYSPAATRRELESLLERAKKGETSSTMAPEINFINENSEIRDQKRPTEFTTKQNTQTNGLDSEESPANSLKSDHDSPSWEGVLKKGARMASRKARAMPQRAQTTGKNVVRSISDKAQTTSSRLFSNESKEKEEIIPEVMDAIIEDFSRDEVSKFDRDRVVEVEAVKDMSHDWTGKDNKSYRVQKKSVQQPQQPPREKSRRRPRPKTRKQEIADTENFLRKGHGSERPINRAAYRLPPADDFNSRTEFRKRGRQTPTDDSRKIYSPYKRTEQDKLLFDRDGLDELGDLVARSVDDFLWGSESNSTSYEPRQRSTTGSRTESKRKAHWKDRMEEQFDTLMGIHEDGKHYKRWMNNELQEEEHADGSDAIAYARGRGRRKRKKHKPSGRPIWEENDSLIGLVFGTTDQKILRDNFLNRSPSILGSTSVLKLLRNLLWSGAFVASGVSRWASVRGSLPQPVVVVGLISTLLTSRPGVRVRNLILVVLTLRSIGELLDGYMYEEDDFFDSKSDEDEMDTTGRYIDEV